MKLFNEKNEKSLGTKSKSKHEIFVENGRTLFGLSKDLIDKELALEAVKEFGQEL